MRNWLILFCIVVIGSMTCVTTMASLDRSVLKGGVGLWPDPWFIATLLDAYFGFLTFYLWVIYKETTWAARFGWLVSILLLGNFAMSAYLLGEVLRLRPFTIEALLLRDIPSGQSIEKASA